MATSLVTNFSNCFCVLSFTVSGIICVKMKNEIKTCVAVVRCYLGQVDSTLIITKNLLKFEVQIRN